MKTDHWLRQAQQQLNIAGIATARLDTLVLLEDCLGQDRALLLAHPETELNDTQLTQLQEWLERRARHEPLAYIRGKSEFYGREFVVNQHVLVPRPESEVMIDLLKQLAATDPPGGGIIADIGTGSGALAITAACELDHKMVMATDVDPKCLKVARQNALTHASPVEFFKGDLLEPLFKRQITGIYALLANLPYVPDAYEINTAANHEPKLALYGGPDGLDLYRRLFEQIQGRPALERPRHILAESLPTQHKALQSIAMVYRYRLQTGADFIQAYQLLDK